MENSKRCSKCGIEKNLEYFSVDRRAKDGRLSKCRACRSNGPRKKLPVSFPKTCTKCGISKPKEGFWLDKDGHGGLRPQCIYCLNLYKWALLKRKELE
jgi:hypothetical protein